MRVQLTLCVMICLISSLDLTLGVDNGLGLTPQMAWNSWNSVGCGINQTIVMSTAKAMVSAGLADAGYIYVNMDDCWAASRNSSGYIQADTAKFPDGVKALADYVHNLGLKFGLYSDAGTETCAGRPGSLDHETLDAAQYASWGVDYLKYDNCNNQGLPDFPRYQAMSRALNSTGRQIFFSLCDWVITTAVWGASVGNSWRTTTDIQAEWPSILNNLDQSNLVGQYAGPGGWNDPDMLEVGNGNLTVDENTAHFSLWALVKAPLILGNDISGIDPQILQILTNKEVIAVNQDPLGVQGVKLSVNSAENASVSDNLLISAPCSNLPSQKWSYNSSDFTLRSAMNQLCLGEYAQPWNCGEQAGLGVNAYLQGCNSICSENLQRWILDTVNNTVRTYFQKQDVKMCLTRVSKLGSEVAFFECNATDLIIDSLQRFSLQSDGTIRSPDGFCLTISGGKEVWGGPLYGGEYVAALLNRAMKSQSITISWSQLGLTPSTKALVRDLWQQKDLGVFFGEYTAMINPHGVNMIKITPST